DGDGRDANAADPGDWITSAEASASTGPFFGCDIDNSSWHGSHVAGTIAAVSNNAAGVAGVNWTSKILPVRVIGKCGGALSDIADGVRWAAGVAVPNAPANLNPAKVINMSLGGDRVCSVTMQSAIDAATAAGAIVVVAAGNSNADLANEEPASCNNVLPVTSITSSGARSNTSSFGGGAFIAAPGVGILSTVNTGSQSPVASPGGDSYTSYSGTSMATPHVAGVVGLLRAANPTITIAKIRAALAASAVPFVSPINPQCYGNTCGAGMLDAAGALSAATSTTPQIFFVTKSARARERQTIQFFVERVGDATLAASVNYATAGGTATSGSDFTPASGTLNWAAGESGRKSFSVTLLSDAVADPSETFTVNLSAPVNVTILGSASATVEIGDVLACTPTPLTASYTEPTTAVG
ncbi:MAG: S8 family serine peptidase, partial [Casimicrobium sp.]